VRITGIWIATDEGERKVVLPGGNYIEVDPAGERPPDFEGLCEQLWKIVQRTARGELTVDKGPPS